MRDKSLTFAFASAVVTAFLGCVKRDPSDGSETSAATTDSESGQILVDLPSEEAVAYSRCNVGCRHAPGFGCSECSGVGCAEPENRDAFSICNAVCETAEDCPEPPIEGKTVCIDQGCYVDCDAGPCPEGQTCLHFLNLTDPRVCMYVDDND